MLGKKVVSTAVISLLLLGTVALPTYADQIGDTLQQQKDILSRKAQAQKKLNTLTYTTNDIKAELARIEKQVAATQLLLGQKQVAYTQAKNQVAAAQLELEEKHEELDDRRQTLGKRARGIYESGQISHLEILFKSSDLSDFITRMEYFTTLVSNDRQLLADIDAQKTQIEQKTRDLQRQSDRAAELKAQTAVASADLEKKKSQQSQALSQNQKAQKAAYDDVYRLEAESKAMTAKIRALQAAQSGKKSSSGSANGTISTWPTPGYYKISSAFGWRIHPITRKRSLHTGTDIPAPTGTKLRAAGDGVVLISGWNTAYGKMIVIDHGGGISTLYGHASRLDVKEGQSVKANQLIGAVGSTGWSTGPHLHFEVRVGGNATDPTRYFSN